MASQNPFMPQGKSFLIAANSVAPSAVQITAYSPDIKTNTVRVQNADANQIIYWGVGPTAEAALANAVIPTSGGNSSLGASPLLIEVLRLNVQTPFWVTGITASATQANLIVTPGDGV